MIKTKGIPIWERHVEKIVLAVAVGVFIFFTVTQFIGDPNAVTDGGTTIGPGDVDRVLVEQATVLKDRLQPDSPSPVPDVTGLEPVSVAFERDLAATISAGDTLPAVLVATELAAGEVTADGQRFTEPQIVAARDLASEQYFDALATAVVDEHEQLQQQFPDRPYDLTWITPVALFDIGKVLAAFQFEDPREEISAIPPRWYGGRVTILDVVIEREEYVDGQWQNLTVLPPLPGHISLRERLQGKVDVVNRDEMLSNLSDPRVQMQIVQPEFYATNLDVWAPPDPRDEDVVKEIAEGDGELDDRAEKIIRNRITLKRLRRERDRVQTRIDEICGGVGGRPGGRPGEGGGGRGRGGGSAPGSGGAPGGGIGGGATGGGGSSGGRRGVRGAADRTAEQCATMRAKLERTQGKIASVERQLADLGEVVVEEVAAEEPENPFEADEILVWGHDLAVEYGSTYRYRFTLQIYNPFFARKINLTPEQEPLADSVTIASASSDWSAPMSVKPSTRIFITNAAAPNPRPGAISIDLGSAMAEVFRFYDGRWWREKFRVEPAKRIGGTKSLPAAGPDAAAATIDFGTNWFVLDIASDPDPAGRDRNAAQVMLQHLITGELHGYLSPAREKRRPELLDLRSQVELAEAQAPEAEEAGGKSS